MAILLPTERLNLSDRGGMSHAQGSNTELKSFTNYLLLL